MTDMKSIRFPPPVADNMVRAILDGRKTAMRRVVKERELIDRPPYRTGDILYVRETWTHTCIHCEHYPDMFFCPPDCGTCPEFAYKADGGSLGGWPDKRWHPSIHMPREAARIFLRVTDVRVERLQDITPEQIDAEGCKEFGYSVETGELMPSSPCYFSIVWNNTVKKADRALYGWEANPLV